MTARNLSPAGRARLAAPSAVAWAASPLGLTVVDAGGCFLAVNPAACAMFGRPEDELVGRPFESVAYPEDRDIGRTDFERMRRGEISEFHHEKRYFRPPAERWWGRVSVSLVTGGNRGPAFAVAVLEDVSARRAAAETVNLHEHHYRSTIDSLEEGIVTFVAGPDGGLEAVTENPAARRILGVDLIGSGPEAFRSGIDKVTDLDGVPVISGEFPIDVAFRTGRSVARREMHVAYLDGHHQWLSVGAQIVRDDSGTVTGVTATFADSTAAHEAEEALESAHTRSAALIEYGSDLITVSDAEGVITFASPACERLLGWQPEDLIGRTVLDWVHPEDRERVAEIHAELLSRPGGTAEYECRLVHRNGSWRHMEVNRTNHLQDPAIWGIVATKRDVTERVEAAERLLRQATHDSLTGLPNRALLLDRLETALARSERGGGRCAVLFLDIDQFKTINDSLGHAAGDRLLQVIGERLATVVRPEDTVARMGGDEFVVLAENVTSGPQAVELAERVRSAVAGPMDLGKRVVSISCSVGIALSDHHGADALLQQADTALYRAKGRGRNRWEMYDQAMRIVARRRLDVEMELRRALDERRVVVAYQPVVRLDDRSLVGVEALVRLRAEDGRTLQPDEFIDAAEDSGLIVPLGASVLQQACAQEAMWLHDAPGTGSPPSVAVNLSARQLAASDLADQVVEVLGHNDLKPTQLCLELTESALIDAGSSTRRTIESLSSMGIRLAIDDFGTGWSSLAYLRRFPIDIIKIDRSFVRGVGRDANDTEVIKAVISLGHALDLTLVAEGIETEEQARILADMGCHHGQGFLFGRPVGPEQVKRHFEPGPEQKHRNGPGAAPLSADPLPASPRGPGRTASRRP